MGRMNEGESPVQAGYREVLEETGFETSQHREIYRVYPINEISAHAFYFVHCCPGKDTGSFNRDEVRATKWIDREEVKRLVREREVHDGFTLAGFLLWLGNWQA